MIIPKTLNQQEVEELTDDELDDLDEYQFWGIVQRHGKVCPVNLDGCVWYTQSSVEDAPDLDGTPLRIDHIDFEGESEAAKVGEVVGQARFRSNIFGLNELRRDDWDSFVEFVEEENGNISLTFNDLVREIHAGNLALSAGLSVGTLPTPLHPFTVEEITQWKEVSIVGAPAVPGSWAWSCGDSCDIVFNEQTMKQLNVDLETLQQEAEDGDVPSQVLEVLESGDAAGVQLTPDGTATVIEDEEELTQSTCQCDENEEKIEQLKQERDEYKTLVEEIEQQQRSQAGERLRELNQQIPEDEQYEDEELEDFIEQASVDHLNQTADMMERVASATPSPDLEEDGEDLGGSSQSESGDEEVEQAKTQVDEVTQDLFGRSAEEVFEDIEKGEFGA